jgi:AraC-like DNA-binding protein
VLILAATLISDEIIEDEYTNIGDENFEDDLLRDLADIDVYRLELSEYSRTNLTRSMENELLDAIKSGEENKLYRLFAKSVDVIPKIGKMADNPIKQYEYMAVIGISLAARAAIESGINEEKAYDINAVYLQKIENCSKVINYFKIVAEATILFTRLVKEEKIRKATSIYVKKAKEYIERNLTTALTCKNIADKIGISSDYLAKIFTSAMNMSIKKYIQTERINKACSLLKYSDTSIQEISAYLGFPTQSYFGKIFKEIKGMTPNQYKMKQQ